MLDGIKGRADKFCKEWLKPSKPKEERRNPLADSDYANIRKPTVKEIPFAMEIDTKGFAHPVYLSPQAHTLVVGTTGGGKSGTTNAILSMLATIGPDNPDGTNADGAEYKGGYVALIGVDLKGGIELSPWLPRLSFLATRPQEVDFLLDKLLEENERRQKFLRMVGSKKIKPNKKWPLIIVLIDELAQATAGGIGAPKEEVVDYNIPQSDKDRQTKLWKLSAVGRSQGIFMICATQRPSADLIPPSFRSNFDQRLAHRVNDVTDAEICMGKGLAKNAPAHTLPVMPGLMYAKTAFRQEPILCRSFFVDEDDCRPIAEENASKRYIIPWLKMPGKLYRGSVMEEFYQREFKKNGDQSKYSNVFDSDKKKSNPGSTSVSFDKDTDDAVVDDLAEDFAEIPEESEEVSEHIDERAGLIDIDLFELLASGHARFVDDENERNSDLDSELDKLTFGDVMFDDRPLNSTSAKPKHDPIPLPSPADNRVPIEIEYAHRKFRPHESGSVTIPWSRTTSAESSDGDITYETPDFDIDDPDLLSTLNGQLEEDEPSIVAETDPGEEDVSFGVMGQFFDDDEFYDDEDFDEDAEYEIIEPIKDAPF